MNDPTGGMLSYFSFWQNMNTAHQFVEKLRFPKRLFPEPAIEIAEGRHTNNPGGCDKDNLHE